MGRLSNDPEKRAKQLANLKPAKKGEVRNKRGRPVNTMRSIVNEMAAKGYAIPNKDEVRDCLMACLGGTEEQIKGVINDKSKPMLLRVVARSILGDNGFSVIEKLLDRTIGKKLDVTTNDKDIKQEPLVVEVIDRAEQVNKVEDE